MHNLMQGHIWHLSGLAYAYLTASSRGSTKINPAAVGYETRSPQWHLLARTLAVVIVRATGRTQPRALF